jgi:hypothetical protein
MNKHDLLAFFTCLLFVFFMVTAVIVPLIQLLN